MTPPDSGERIAATQADGATCLNPWLHGHSAVNPCRCGNKPPVAPPARPVRKPDTRECPTCMGDGVVDQDDVDPVSLPLSLAQRILAAMEDIDTQEVRAIRAELRARVPR